MVNVPKVTCGDGIIVQKIPGYTSIIHGIFMHQMVQECIHQVGGDMVGRIMNMELEDVVTVEIVEVGMVVETGVDI
jgi:hypothetical protein